MKKYFLKIKIVSKNQLEVKLNGLLLTILIFKKYFFKIKIVSKNQLEVKLNGLLLTIFANDFNLEKILFKD